MKPLPALLTGLLIALVYTAQHFKIMDEIVLFSFAACGFYVLYRMIDLLIDEFKDNKKHGKTNCQ